PTLFGYTDQSVDPREAEGADDPRLQSYEGVLPGFEAVCHLPTGAPTAWTDWLRAHGYKIPDDPQEVLASEPERPAEHTMSGFLPDRFWEWLEGRDGPWFAHGSQLRPPSPYAAAGRFSTMSDPAGIPLPIAAATDRHWLHEGLMRERTLAAPIDE